MHLASSPIGVAIPHNNTQERTKVNASAGDRPPKRSLLELARLTDPTFKNATTSNLLWGDGEEAGPLASAEVRSCHKKVESTFATVSGRCSINGAL